jgi:hypothetical protein
MLLWLQGDGITSVAQVEDTDWVYGMQRVWVAAIEVVKRGQVREEQSLRCEQCVMLH